MRLRPIALTLLPLLAACSAGPKVAENGYPVLPPSQLAVFDELSDVPDEFEILGVVSLPPQAETARAAVVSASELARLRVRTPEDRARMEREEAQRRALRMGANAVLVVNPDEVNAEPRIHEALSGTSWRTEQHYLALYVGPPPTVDSTDS